MTTREQAIARAYDVWAQKWATRVEPDPAYADNKNYTQGIVALSSGAEADAELQRLVARELKAAGLEVNPWSVK